MEYMIDVWIPDLENEAKRWTATDRRDHYKHFLDVKVRANNEEEAIEKAFKAAWGELSPEDKKEINQSDLMYDSIKEFTGNNEC